MIRILAVVILLAFSSLAVAHPTQKQIKRKPGDEQAVRKAEDEIAAALDRNDADALDRLWPSDYSFVNPFGLVFTKAQRLASLRTGALKIQSYTLDQETIRIYGTTAIVTYRSTVKAQHTGPDIPSQRRVTTVLLKRNGRWQAVHQQSTPIMAQP